MENKSTERTIQVAEIKEVAYNKIIDNNKYGYAVYIDFYDDPYSSGWQSGDDAIIIYMGGYHNCVSRP